MIKTTKNKLLNKIKNQMIRFRVIIISKFVLKNIAIEDVYTGGFNGDRKFDYEHAAVSSWHPSYLLKDFPHVKFLQQYKDCGLINPEEFKKSEYFNYGCKDMRIYGDFFGIKDEAKIIKRASDFLSFYQQMRDKKCGKGYIFFPGDANPNDCFITVSSIPNSKYFLIRSGHHRLAIYYVLGNKTIKARIIGKADISLKVILQKLALQNQKVNLI